MTQPLSFCGSLVKAYDPDRFLLTMFVPEQVRDPSSPAATTRREALWALFAFNHEIAKTRAVVSEPQLGRIRLQWWRDEIERIYSGSVVPEHEVLKPLAAAIRAHDLPREDFETLITAREADLAGAPLKDLDAVLAYADATSTPLLSLAVRVCGEDPVPEPVYPVAVNYALMGILRAAPFLAGRGQGLLPAAGRDDVRAIAAHVVSGLRPGNRLLRAAHAMAVTHARHLRSCRYDVFSSRFLRPPAFREIRLFFNFMKGV